MRVHSVLRNASSLFSKARRNACGVQMVPEFLWKQLFTGQPAAIKYMTAFRSYEHEAIKQHLEEFGLWGKEPEDAREPEPFDLPPLLGGSLPDHFETIALDQRRSAWTGAEQLADAEPPPPPQEWLCQPGWTKYNGDGTAEAVQSPGEQALVFDIENCVLQGQHATLAIAMSPTAWYGWVSEALVSPTKPDKDGKELHEPELIPLQGCGPDNKVVVGHFVAYDRSKCKEEYSLRPSSIDWLDTMSLHAMVAGMSTKQLQAWRYNQNKKSQDGGEAAPSDAKWLELTAPMSLVDCVKYWTGADIKKDRRDLFVKGTLQDIRDDFQNMMQYCALDVAATFKLFQHVFDEFNAHQNSPVTSAGMLEMMRAYLPVNEGWSEYLERAQDAYDTRVAQSSSKLQEIVHDALLLNCTDKCHETNGADPSCECKWKSDPWLCHVDWSTVPIKYKKDGTPYKNQKLPGKPEWYRQLWKGSTATGSLDISPRKTVAPYLFRMEFVHPTTNTAYPLYHHPVHKWGYLVPAEDAHLLGEGGLSWTQLADDSKAGELERKESMAKGNGKAKKVATKSNYDAGDEFYDGEGEQRANEDSSEPSPRSGSMAKKSSNSKPMQTKGNSTKTSKKSTPPPKATTAAKKSTWACTQASNVMYHNHVFFKLPHKDGPKARCGSPFAKEYLSMIEKGQLHSEFPEASIALQSLAECSYWSSAQDRITNQLVVWEDTVGRDKLGSMHPDTYSRNCSGSDEPKRLGAILPQIVPGGTISRRARENTWLTAANAKKNKIGSELKSMTCAPPGYKFVGADVDSQELWIASLFGDAAFAKMHGSTAIAWMTLQGSKAAGTDVHTATAEILGCSRDQAKIFNYGRIYGAGVRFAQQLLQQFNPAMSNEEARQKARDLYAKTKGVKQNGKFYGGSESAMFSALEESASASVPRTPVLKFILTAALQPRNLPTPTWQKGKTPSFLESNFATTRVNWMVQSSAVDYLHLMLTNMRYLISRFNMDARLAITIHDEARYICADKDVARFALALHITNMYTRAMFAHAFEMYDLPLGVAFFSCVDVDTVLRKEVIMDCVTPSNPTPIPPGYTLDVFEAGEACGWSLEPQASITA
eukprot:m.102709 g.102709  ORF g.102709 m.102709 type:complete len:1101 (+) comp13227_c0_seq7:304-3606(+)